MSELTDSLYQDPSLVEFYDIENANRDDFEFCAVLAKDAGSVLDLGCGTGQFAVMVASGRRVVGVDPAAAMLEIARKRDGGKKVRWVQGDARTIRLGEKFDLVVLTGHAFQEFRTDADIAAVLETTAAHLNPEGRFIFDTRNPAGRAWESWTPQRSERIIAHPAYGHVKAWYDATFDAATEIASYRTFYEIPAVGKILSAGSQIRFIDKNRIAHLITEAGLEADTWLGDWKGAPWTTTSKEIIPVGRLS